MGAVRVYFDSNVLIASIVRSHQHHVPSLSALLTARKGTVHGVVSAHGLAETYGFVSRALYPDLLSPLEAWNAVSTNILPFFSLVPLAASDYRVFLERCASLGVVGGRIYDALHIQAAIKSKCERLYTFNVKHFRNLAPVDFVDRIVLPGSN
ncbi:MAG: hypothetical protein DMG61_23380 [Acidobacteria bacterium]|nr:MAG: hypothetical protein DMG61_23380 [Acidobacteriota bacterium]